MGLSNAAIIVIVLVACLATTALGASLFKHYKPADGETPFSPGYEQKVYMAEVRARGFESLRQISWGGRDLESRCMFPWWLALIISLTLIRSSSGAGLLPPPHLHRRHLHLHERHREQLLIPAFLFLFLTLMNYVDICWNEHGRYTRGNWRYTGLQRWWVLLGGKTLRCEWVHLVLGH